MKAQKTITEAFGETPYKTLVEEIKDFAIFHIDLEGCIVSWNQGAETIFGYSKDAIIGQALFTIFAPEDQAEGIPERELKTAAETGRAEDTRWHLRKDGSRFYANGATTALRNERGKLLGYAKVVRDLTEHKLAEDSVRESEKLNRLIFEQSPLSIQILSPDGYIIKVNKAWEELWGVSLDQIQGYNIFEDEQLEKKGIMPYIKLAFEGQFVEIPPVSYNPDETIRGVTSHIQPQRWTKAVIYPIKNSDSEVQEVILMHKDITNHILAEERVKASESRYFSLLENANDIIYSHDLLGNHVAVNRAAEKITGYSLEELRKMNITEFIVPEHHERIKEVIEKKLHDPTPSVHEFDIITKDGQRRTLEVNPKISAIEGEALTIEGVARDVTERKQAEEKLEQTNLRIENILSSISDSFYRFDRELRYVYVNEATTRMFGLTETEFLGKTLWEVFPNVKGNLFHAELLRAFNEQTNVVFENHYPPYNRWFENRAYPSTDGLSVFTSEITERKRAEELRIERERLAILNSELSLTLVQRNSLPEILQSCTEIIVKHLDAAFARIWTLDEEENILELQASAGIYTHLDGAHSRVPVGKYKIGLIAEERKPHLTNSVVGDSRVRDQEWAKREGMVAFAGYPLIIGERLIGVVAMFARHTLGLDAFKAIEAAANVIALGIEGKRAEENLKYQKMLLESLTESVTDGILIVSLDGKILHFNEPFQRIWNFPPEIIESRSDEEALKWAANQTADPAAFLLRVGNVYQQPDTKVREELVMKDGRVFDRFGAPVLNEGTRLGWVWTFQDITERKQAEELLRESEERLRLATGVAQMYSWEMDLTTQEVKYSDNAVVPLKSDVLPKNLEEVLKIVHSEDREGLSQKINHAISKAGTFTHQYRAIDSANKINWFESHAITVRDSQENPVRFICITQNITERKQVEEIQQTWAKRLEEAREDERRRLSRQLHDDIVQQLSVASIKLGRLEEKLVPLLVEEEEEVIFVDIVVIQELLNRNQKSLREMAHKLYSGVLEHFGLIEAFRRFRTDANIFSKDHSTTLSLDVSPAFPRLELGIENGIYRIAQEAIINAFKHAGANLISLSLDIRDDSVFVTIGDDGRGFDLEKIKGSGIGLASMSERANLMGAKIDITSQPGRGTTITLQVPLDENRQRKKMLS